jgi:NAD(P)-dependent dehydrogenase (short-subunit alcohol dehydrogenase family)
MRLAEKVTVISGAASGQGRAAARLFAAEGAKLVLADWDEPAGRNVESDLRAVGHDVMFVRTDVAQAVEVRELAEVTLRKHGRVDVLYNNAAVSFSGPFRVGTVLDIPEEDWDRLVAVNLKSVYLMVKAFLPSMLEARSGSIINTSSTNALVGMVNNDSYTAAKGGVLSLTRSLAVRYGKYGVRVNALIPGPIDTPMIAGLLTKSGAREGTAALTALRRLGRPEEIAQCALFLASDESSFVTGSALVADGGQTAM